MVHTRWPQGVQHGTRVSRWGSCNDWFTDSRDAERVDRTRCFLVCRLDGGHLCGRGNHAFEDVFSQELSPLRVDDTP